MNLLAQLSALPAVAPRSSAEIAETESLYLTSNSEMATWLLDNAGGLRDALQRLAAIEATGTRPTTPSSDWAAAGASDPHGDLYDGQRAALTLGHMTDDYLANAAFLGYDQWDAEYGPLVYMTGVKDRIRWLSRALRRASAPVNLPPSIAQALETAGANAALSDLVAWNDRMARRPIAEPLPQPISAALGEIQEMWDFARLRGGTARLMRGWSDALSAVEHGLAAVEPRTVQAEPEEGVALLDEVRRAFTRDDDLPDELLPRIDTYIEGQRAAAADDGLTLPVEVVTQIRAQWADLNAAFKGAFDNPLARRRDDSVYAQDARKRFSEFDETLNDTFQQAAEQSGSGPVPLDSEVRP